MDLNTNEQLIKKTSQQQCSHSMYISRDVAQKHCATLPGVGSLVGSVVGSGVGSEDQDLYIR